ncbi:hypothetical protein ACGF7W_33540 [Streptomyces sp. NPDC048219]|uniref:hypothetical protein n=1 Tax=Streptomyces sp. NPDC048219 TaxID=3365517 RepID=UPI0037197381
MPASLPPLPEHTVAAYAQEQASVQRMILEACWAHAQRDTIFEHPGTFRDDQVHRIQRAHLIHLGALYDVLALRGAHDLDVHEAARGLGTNLLAHDGFHLPTTPRSGIDYLRTNYAALHGRTDVMPQPAAGLTAVHNPAPERADMPLYCPTESRLVRTMLWTDTVARECRRRGDSLQTATQVRAHHIARGLLLWCAAALAPADRAAAQAAARAGHLVRESDGRPRTSDEKARQYLLETYLDEHPDEIEQSHEPDCPGGCGGTAVVMATLTWDDQGDGIFVPVWAEPVDCTAGAPQAHDPDCSDCHGHGFTYSRGERHLCGCLAPVDLPA